LNLLLSTSRFLRFNYCRFSLCLFPKKLHANILELKIIFFKFPNQSEILNKRYANLTVGWSHVVPFIIAKESNMGSTGGRWELGLYKKRRNNGENPPGGLFPGDEARHYRCAGASRPIYINTNLKP
jgi:hypothetical protein